MPPEEIRFNARGKEFAGQPGDTLLTALLNAGITEFRKGGHAPICAMGICFECLVTLEGASVRACMTLLEEGMEVEF